MYTRTESLEVIRRLSPDFYGERARTLENCTVTTLDTLARIVQNLHGEYVEYAAPHPVFGSHPGL